MLKWVSRLDSAGLNIVLGASHACKDVVVKTMGHGFQLCLITIQLAILLWLVRRLHIIDIL